MELSGVSERYPLGVALCTTEHLENLFAGHADHALQSCVTDMSLLLQRASVERELGFTAGVVQFLL